MWRAALQDRVFISRRYCHRKSFEHLYTTPPSRMPGLKMQNECKHAQQSEEHVS